MLFCPAALPLSRQTPIHSAGIIRRHRRQIGSPWRKLAPGRQALLVLAYLRKGETFAELAAGFGVGTATATATATAWRYVTETVALLAARSPKLRQALRDAAKAGHTYLVIDGTLIPIDRVAAGRPFYSGKHRKHGMNLQVIASPARHARPGPQSPRWICRSAISCRVPRAPGGESPICAPHGKSWRDAPGAIPADSVIVPAARADGTSLDIEARDDGPASRPASCRTRSSGPGGRRPARRLSQGPAPPPAAGLGCPDPGRPCPAGTAGICRSSARRSRPPAVPTGPGRGRSRRSAPGTAR